MNLGVRGLETLDLRSYLELFLFDPHKQLQKVGSLSGGERARVALAKVLRQGANLLVFDEPTNDLDLPTLAAFEELLSGFDGSVLVVTHDRAFLDRVATSILAFERPAGAPGSARVRRYAGGYQDYLLQREAKSVPRATDAPTPPTATVPPPGKGRAKGGLTYAERLELDAIVEKIEAAEKAVAEVEALLGDPSLYAKRGVEVAGLQARLEMVKAEAALCVARWEELEAKKAAT